MKKIINAKIIKPDRIIDGMELAFDGKKIKHIGKDIPGCEEVIDAKGLYLSPGFIDRHIHGGWGYDFASGNKEQMVEGLYEYAKYGATSIFPTVFFSFNADEELWNKINVLQEVIEEQNHGPEMCGIHFEGPFGHKKEYPIYLNKEKYSEIIDRLPYAKVWTVDPEVDKAAEFVKYIADRGIIASLGHSENCTYEKFTECVEAGARNVTHIYSSMNGVYKTDNGVRLPGAVECSIMYKNLYVEVLSDASHLSPEIVKFLYGCMGAERIFLSTDCHKRDRKYIKGEPKITRRPDPTGRMSWYSSASMDDIVRITYKECNISLVDTVKMATFTPASALNLSDRKGVLSEGYDADLILFDDDINVKFVCARGEVILNEI